MAWRDLLAQYGVEVRERERVFALIRSLPLAGEVKVRLWEEYAAEQGFEVGPDERAAVRV